MRKPRRRCARLLCSGCSSKTAITFIRLIRRRPEKKMRTRTKQVNKVGDASLTPIHCDCLLMDWPPNDVRPAAIWARRAEVGAVARMRPGLSWSLTGLLLLTRTCDDGQRVEPSAGCSWLSADDELAVKSRTVTFSRCPGAILKASTHCANSISAPDMYPSTSWRTSNPDSWQALSSTSTTVQRYTPRVGYT